MAEQAIALRVTFDPEANTSCIYLAGQPATGWRHGKTITVDPHDIGGMVNIDSDDDGRITGIEVLDARSLLSDKLLGALKVDPNE